MSVFMPHAQESENMVSVPLHMEYLSHCVSSRSKHWFPARASTPNLWASSPAPKERNFKMLLNRQRVYARSSYSKTYYKYDQNLLVSRAYFKNSLEKIS